MRKSSHVPLTLLATLALTGAATGCDDRPKEVRNCVDAQNHIVPDQKCQQPQNGGAGGSYAGSGSGGGYTGGYRWVYGGSSGENVGDTVFGSSPTPAPGVEVVSRGGFGHGGGEGGEGGDGGGHGGGGGE
ncbi:hypothetical protein [Silvibacterium sp.]|uniref:hypothetical protein n=1 Tax=Silvibacterium sp. TaxID=1964179 RepID=UPI0039E57340